MRGGRLRVAAKRYCFFSVVSELPELPDAAGVEGEVGELLDDEDEGLLEPLAALPLGEAGAVPDALELDEPPEAPEAGGVAGVALEEELELLSVDDGAVPETEPDAEPDGAVLAEPDGEVVEPADEDEPGARAPVVLVASRSQPASRVAPSAMETATARVESFM